MDLPKADDLRALLTAARDCGVTKLRIGPDGSINVELAVQSPAERVIQEIDRGAALPADPFDVIRREAAAGNTRPAQDMLDVLASGGRLVETNNGDPTQAV